jgi:hypothetical protein
MGMEIFLICSFLLVLSAAILNVLYWIIYKHETLFLTVLESGESKITAPADSVFGEVVILHILTSEARQKRQKRKIWCLHLVEVQKKMNIFPQIFLLW